MLILKELKESYVDLLKIIQCVFIFIANWYAVYFIICYIWLLHTDNIVFNTITAMLEGLMLYYYIINLFSWYMLMYHIKVLTQLRIGIEYNECK